MLEHDHLFLPTLTRARNRTLACRASWSCSTEANAARARPGSTPNRCIMQSFLTRWARNASVVSGTAHGVDAQAWRKSISNTCTLIWNLLYCMSQYAWISVSISIYIFWYIFKVSFPTLWTQLHKISLFLARSGGESSALNPCCGQCTAQSSSSTLNLQSCRARSARTRSFVQLSSVVVIFLTRRYRLSVAPQSGWVAGSGEGERRSLAPRRCLLSPWPDHRAGIPQLVALFGVAPWGSTSARSEATNMYKVSGNLNSTYGSPIAEQDSKRNNGPVSTSPTFRVRA